MHIKIKNIINEIGYIDEDYPPTWNIEIFKSLLYFSKRIAYCEEHLERLASGSSRIVYKIDEQKVLKLAKNKKGIAQNTIESAKFFQDSYEDIVAKVFATDENDLWLEMELAKKLTPSRFKALVGESLSFVGEYILMKHKLDHGHKYYGYFDPVDKAEEIKRLNNNEWIQRLYNLIVDADLMIGDLTRISSYGEVIRNNKPAVVIVDVGLSKGVWDDFYGVS